MSRSRIITCQQRRRIPSGLTLVASIVAGTVIGIVWNEVDFSIEARAPIVPAPAGLYPSPVRVQTPAPTSVSQLPRAQLDTQTQTQNQGQTPQPLPTTSDSSVLAAGIRVTPLSVPRSSIALPVGPGEGDSEPEN